MAEYENIRIADISSGKAKDGGYRGVHVQFQLSSFHYPVEIQYNTHYDRQLNKRGYKNQAGYCLRQEYELYHFLETEQEFEEAVKNLQRL